MSSHNQNCDRANEPPNIFFKKALNRSGQSFNVCTYINQDDKHGV